MQLLLYMVLPAIRHLLMLFGQMYHFKMDRIIVLILFILGIVMAELLQGLFKQYPQVRCNYYKYNYTSIELPHI